MNNNKKKSKRNNYLLLIVYLNMLNKLTFYLIFITYYNYKMNFNKIFMDKW